MLQQIAFFGKGGIGKSTIASNVAAALAEKGLKVMMVGCDPKSDCTRNLRGDTDIPTISEVLRQKTNAQLDLDEFVYGKEVAAEEIIFEGYKRILCTEVGGPEPGVGCAGRGIIVAVDLLKKMNIFERFNLDIVIYDILGDIVCGGFGMNLRRGMADAAVVVTSADYLAIYAANNICRGIARYAGRGGTSLGGFIYNVRGVIDDPELVEEFAREAGSQILGTIPSEQLIMESEIYGQTVIERYPESELAGIFRELSEKILKNKHLITPLPLTSEKLFGLARRIREKARGKRNVSS